MKPKGITNQKKNRNFIQEKNDRFSNCGLEAWDSVATRSGTQKPQTDYKIQNKGIMVVCYFGIVFNRHSQLDHGLVVGLPLCEAKRHHKSTILNRNFIQEKNDRYSNRWFGSLGFCCNKI